MLNKIIHYSLHNRLVVVCAAILLLIAGTYTAMHTEVDVFPDLNAPTVVIMFRYSSMGIIPVRSYGCASCPLFFYQRIFRCLGRI